MARKKKINKPSWNDIEVTVNQLSKDQLVALINDLYIVSQDNRDFFHTRFLPEEDHISYYKSIIKNSIHPYLENNEPLQIEAANEVINRYSIAANDSIGDAELRIYYVECGNNFTLTYGDIDEDFYDTVLEMYEYAIEAVMKLPQVNQSSYKARLQKIMESASGIGWGYYDGLCDLYYEAFSQD